MGCCSGLNAFISVPVPPTNGVGPLVDVSSLGAKKTVYLGGKFSGRYDLLGSHDSTNFVPIVSFPGGREVQSQLVDGVYKFFRLRRSADATVIVAVAGQRTCPCVCSPITATIEPQENGTFLITFSSPVDFDQVACGGFGPPCCQVTVSLTLGFATIDFAPDGLSAVVTPHIFLTDGPPILTIKVNQNLLCPLNGKNGCPVTPLTEDFVIGGGGGDESF